MPEVRLITPITRQNTKKMQVAAYCRVSSNSADQLNSYRVALHQPTGLRQEILQRFPHHYGGQATGGHRSSGQQV